MGDCNNNTIIETVVLMFTSFVSTQQTLGTAMLQRVLDIINTLRLRLNTALTFVFLCPGHLSLNLGNLL